MSSTPHTIIPASDTWALVEPEEGAEPVIWPVVAWGFPHTDPDAGQAILNNGYGRSLSVDALGDDGGRVLAVGSRHHVEVTLTAIEDARQP